MNNVYNRASVRQRLLGTVGASICRYCPGVAGAGVAGILMLAMPHSAKALNLYDGDKYNNNLQVNLTTTLSYTGLYRVNDPSKTLLNGDAPTGNANGNDGDSNFQHGIVGNLFSALPVLDIRDGDFGAHFSAQFYINTPYLGTNSNDTPSSLNSIYVPKSTDFASGTRNVNGEDYQLLDAFVLGQHTFGNGQSVQVKVGRQTLFWGQSLFYPTDGISGGQAPINTIVAQDTINPQAQQVYMPVGQAVVTYQPNPTLTIQGYYQFQWQHDLFQGSGAYFNAGDYIDAGGQSVIAATGVPGVPLGNVYFLRNKDITPPSQNGQFGLSAQAQLGAWGVGIYGLRFDAKAPVVYANPGQNAGLVTTPTGPRVSGGTYTVVYPRDIWLQGVSASHSLGAANVAGEISAREHMPLLPAGFGIQTAANMGNANSDPLYPVGNTLDGQISTIYVSPGIPGDPGGVQFFGEAVMLHLIGVTNNRAALRPNGQGTAASFTFAITPTYYDVLPNLEVQFPIGLTYGVLGRSQIDQSMQHGTGTFNVGVTGTYNVKWIASLAYQDFLGKASWNGDNTTYNELADRGYMSLNLQYSF